MENRLCISVVHHVSAIVVNLHSTDTNSKGSVYVCMCVYVWMYVCVCLHGCMCVCVCV